MIYYMGIVDILQEFNMKKRLESAYKTRLQVLAGKDPTLISAVDSSVYVGGGGGGGGEGRYERSTAGLSTGGVPAIINALGGSCPPPPLAGMLNGSLPL